MKKRIIALLLCIAMTVSMVGCVGVGVVPKQMTDSEQEPAEVVTPTPVVSEEPTPTPAVSASPSPEVTETPAPTEEPTPTPVVSPDAGIAVASEEGDGSSDESSITLTAVPAGVTPTEESLDTQIAYVANNTVTVYEYYENGALGMIITDAKGDQIELTKKFTYTVDGVDTVIYHFAASDYESAIGAADDANYQFILATDVTFTAEEVEPTPTPTPSLTPTDKTDEDTGVAISANLPTDVTLDVTTKTLAESGLDTTAYPVNGASLFYDVTLLQSGAEYQPTEGITITFPEAAVTNSGLAAGDYYKVYHIHDGATDVTGPFEYTGGAIEASFDSLSVVGVVESGAGVKVTDVYGDFVSEESFSGYAVINSDPVRVYGAADTGTTDYYELSGVKGIALELISPKATYANGVLYHFVYNGTDETMATVDYYFIPEEFITITCCASCTGDADCTCGCEDCPGADAALKSTYEALMGTGNLDEYEEAFNALDDETKTALKESSYWAEIEPYFFHLVYSNFYATSTEAEYNAAVAAYPDAWDYIQADAALKAAVEKHLARIRFVAANPEIKLELSDDIITVRLPSYTKAAGLLKPSEVASVASYAVANSRMTSFNLPRATTYESAADALTADTNGNGIVLEKEVKEFDSSTGVGTIRLEAYATGSKVTSVTTTQLPADIILVLDLSNSMTMYNMDVMSYRALINGTAEQVFEDYEEEGVFVEIDGEYHEVTITANNPTTGTDYNAYSNSGNHYRARDLYEYIEEDNRELYYKDEDGEYHSISVERTGYNNDSYRYKFYYTVDGEEEVIIQNVTRNQNIASDVYPFYTKTTATVYESYTYSYKDADGQTVSNTYTPDESIVGGTNPAYYIAYEDGSISRAEALEDAVTNFASEVATKAKGTDGQVGGGDDIAHNIAIVGFSGSSQPNTGVYIGSTIDTYSNGVAASSYQNALQDMSTTTGVNNINASINALDNTQGTYTYCGTEMALGILAAQPADRYVNEKGETIRSKVVIIFTDGDPSNGRSGGTNSDYNDPISDAHSIKNTYGATVYTVGVLDGGSITPIPPTSNLNKFMHYMSSNYQNARSLTNSGDFTNTQYAVDGSSYYLLASSAGDLNNIFSSIQSSATEGGSSSTLTESAEVRDLISPYFQLPENADASSISVYTSDYKYDDTNGAYWDTPVAFSATVEVSGKNVDVSNFNYSANWVGTETAADGTVTHRGKKLIIEVPFVVEENFLGGDDVITNGNDFAIYDSTTSTEALETVESPIVDVDLKPITNVAKDKHIYYTNTTDLTGILDLYIRVDETEENNLRIVADGVNNAYVDLVYDVTVKVDGVDTTFTYTVPAGKTWAEGTWTQGGSAIDMSAIELEDNTDYTVKCTMTSINDRTKSVETTDSATIYVYKPELTFKDAVKIPYTDSVNYPADDYVSEAWKRADGTASTAVTMEGTKPTLTLTYTPDANCVNGSGLVTTINDFYVNVKVEKVEIVVDEEGNSTEVRTDLTDKTSFVHQACSDGEAFDKDLGEFIIHVQTGDLVITKEVEGIAAAVRSYTFNVTYVTKNGHTYTETVVLGGSAADALGALMTGEMSKTLTDLVPGAYTVEEVGSLEQEGYDYLSTSYTVNGTLVEDTDLKAEVTVSALGVTTVVYTNKYQQLGDLTVTKVVEGYTGAKEFTFEVTDASGNAVKSFKLTNGKSYTVEDLYPGAYTITETGYEAPTGYRYLGTDVSGAIEGTTEAVTTATVVVGENTEVTYTNKYEQLGNLTVIKSLKGIAASLRSYEFTITGPDGYSNVIELGGIGGMNETLKNLVPGEYTITETTPEHMSGYKYLSTSYQIDDGAAVAGLVAKVTVVSGGTAKVTYLNEYQPYGKLEISKTVVDATGASHTIDKTQQEFTFTVTFSDGNTYKYTKDGTSYDLPADGKLTLKHGESVLFEEIPTGVTYTVTETAVDGFTADSLKKSATIQTNTTSEAAFTNTYSAALGNLDITKKIVEEYANDSHPGGTFTFVVKGTNLTVQPGEYTIKVGDEERTVTVADKAVTFNVSITVEASDADAQNTLSITGLPAGDYEIEELDDNENYNCDDPQYATVAENKTGEATVTNTYPRTSGALTIKKQILNNSADAVLATAFTFLVTTEDTTVDLTAKLQAGNGISNITKNSFEVTITAEAAANSLGEEQSLTISGLPSATYTVTEINIPGAFSPDFDSNPDVITKSATVTILDNSQTVKCVNTYPVGDLTINKTVETIPGATVPTGNKAPKFTFKVEGEAVVSGKEYTILVDGEETTQIADGDALVVTLEKTAVIHDLELKSYSVTEWETGNEYILISDSYVNGTITADDNAVAAFTNLYVPRGDLRVSKFIDKQYPDDPQTFDNEKEFAFTVTLNPDLNEKARTGNFVFAVKRYNDGVNLDDVTLVKNGTFNVTSGFKNDNGVLTFSLKNNEFIEIYDLPACTYNITEADYTVDYMGPNFMYEEENHVPAIPANGTENVQCYNTMKRTQGNLAITKIVTSINEIDGLDTFKFTVALNNLPLFPEGTEKLTYEVEYSVYDKVGTLNGYQYTVDGKTFDLPQTVTLEADKVTGELTAGTIELELHNGLTATIKGLPACGYVVTEEDYSAQYYGTTWTGDTGIIGGNSTQSAVCTNIAGMDRGNLRIDKTIDKPEGNPVSTETFEVKVELDGTDANSATYVYKVYNESDGSEVDSGTFTPGDTLKLKEDQYIIIENILAGRNATVTEIIPDNAKYTVNYKTNEGTRIISGDTIDIEVVNSFVGELTITKKVTSGENGTFLFHVVCEQPHDSTKIEMDVVITTSGLDKTGTVKIKDLPLGTYTVTENTEWSWRYEAVGGASKSAEIKINDLSKSVEFSNKQTTDQWLNHVDTVDNMFTATASN